jgi:hypothetical protein
MEAMGDLLGENYNMLTSGTESIAVLNSHLDDSDYTNAMLDSENIPETSSNVNTYHRPPKTLDDYVFHFYVGSLTVVGLFAFFRMMQKN